MKDRTILMLSLLLVSPGFLLAAVPDETDTAIQPAATAPDPFVALGNTLRSSTFADRSKLTQAFEEFDQQLKIIVAEKRAYGQEGSAEAKEKFSDARDELAAKIRELSLTDVTTWQSGQENALAALHTLRLSLRDI